MNQDTTIKEFFNSVLEFMVENDTTSIDTEFKFRDGSVTFKITLESGVKSDGTVINGG